MSAVDRRRVLDLRDRAHDLDARRIRTEVGAPQDQRRGTARATRRAPCRAGRRSCARGRHRRAPRARAPPAPRRARAAANSGSTASRTRPFAAAAAAVARTARPIGSWRPRDDERRARPDRDTARARRARRRGPSGCGGRRSARAHATSGGAGCCASAAIAGDRDRRRQADRERVEQRVVRGRIGAGAELDRRPSRRPRRRPPSSASRAARPRPFDGFLAGAFAGCAQRARRAGQRQHHHEPTCLVAHLAVVVPKSSARFNTRRSVVGYNRMRGSRRPADPVLPALPRRGAVQAISATPRCRACGLEPREHDPRRPRPDRRRAPASRPRRPPSSG